MKYRCKNCGRKTLYYRKDEKNYRCHRCGNIFLDKTPENNNKLCLDKTPENNNKLCEAEVRKNLVLAEIGIPLTIPLSILNSNCDFKKEWDRIQRKWHKKKVVCINCGIDFPISKGLPIYCSPECRKAYRETPEAKAKKKAYHKAYYQTPEVKAKQKAYRETPEVKAKRKAYNKAYRETPEAKAKRKAYYQTPEAKAKQKAYRETPEVKAKRKAYRETPEVKAKQKAYYIKKKKVEDVVG